MGKIDFKLEANLFLRDNETYFGRNFSREELIEWLAKYHQHQLNAIKLKSNKIYARKK